MALIKILMLKGKVEAFCIRHIVLILGNLKNRVIIKIIYYLTMKF